MSTAILLAALLAGPANRESAQDDAFQRAQAHYLLVAEELAAADHPGLSPEVAGRRGELLQELLRYRAAGDFTRNPEAGVRQPLFVDAAGNHCAVANLLRFTGETELVARVAAASNDAFIADLSGDAAFRTWLGRVGLTFDEAARIQFPALPHGPSPATPTGNPFSNPLTGGSLGNSMTAAGEAFTDWGIWWEFNKLEWMRPRPLGLGAPWTGDGPRAGEEPLAVARRAARAQLAQELTSTSASVRASAALAYARAAGAEALPELERLLGDPAREVRLAALFGCAATGSEEGVHALLGIVASDEEPGPDLRAAAVVALGAACAEGHGAGVAGMLPSLLRERGDDEAYALFVLPALAPGDELLAEAKRASGLFDGRRSDPDGAEMVVQRATGALSRGPAQEVLTPLLHAAGGHDAEVRRAAALALGEVDGALAPLMSAYEGESEPLARGFALLAIGRQGGEAARGFLARELAQGPSQARPWCALALGILAERDGDAEACAALRKGYAREKNRTSRGAYLLALGIARDRGAQELLIDALAASDSATRSYAAQGLGLLAVPAGREALRASLAVEGTPLVRTAMAQALALHGDPRDAGLLLSELRSVQSPLLRAQVAAALGFHGSSAAVDGLLASLRRSDLSGESRAAAVAALAVGLSGRDRMTLGAASAWSNYAAFPGWFLEALQQPL
jgi:HEAT repeat protein